MITLKEFPLAKLTDWQPKRNIQLTRENQGGTTQTIMLTKLTMVTPKTPMVKAALVGKKTMQFVSKPST